MSTQGGESINGARGHSDENPAQSPPQARKLRLIGVSMDDDSGEERILVGGPIELRPQRMKALVYGDEIDLWPSEVIILELFLQSPGRVVSRAKMLSEVSRDRQTSVRDFAAMHKRVSRLRKKLGPAGRWIRTIRGAGYMFCMPDDHPHTFLATVIGLFVSALVGARSWAYSHKKLVFLGSSSSVVLFTAAVFFLYGSGSVGFGPASSLHRVRSHASSVSSVQVGDPVAVPGVSFSDWSQIGHGLAAVPGRRGAFVSISTPWNPLSQAPASIRPFEVGLLGNTAVFSAGDEIELQSPGSASAESVRLGRVHALAVTAGGELSVMPSDGSGLAVFDSEGMLTEIHDAAERDSFSGSGDIVSMLSGPDWVVACGASGLDSEGSGAFAPLVWQQLSSGDARTYRYPLESGTSRVVGVSQTGAGRVLVLESAGDGLGRHGSVYLARLHEQGGTEFEKELLFRLPSLPSASIGPAGQLRYEAIAASDLNEHECLVVISAVSSRGAGLLRPVRIRFGDPAESGVRVFFGG